MAQEYHRRILLLFVDGVGLAAAEDNPFSEAEAPAFEGLLGGPLTAEQAQESATLVLLPIDATLGVTGLPQSATGQTTLFTGVNAAQWMGRHVTGLPGPRLRRLIEEKSLFSQVRAIGKTATFANAYSSAYLAGLAEGRTRPSVTTCAVEAAGLSFRTQQHLLAGKAVTWDIERDLYGRWTGSQLEQVDAELAGEQLGLISNTHDLTVFETFLPDLAGHRRVEMAGEEVVRRLDRLVAGVLTVKSPETVLILTSDHGNFEVPSTRTHTRNPVPFLAVGSGAGLLAGVTSLAQVTARMLEFLTLDEVPESVPS
jgi:hypothetical protein